MFSLRGKESFSFSSSSSSSSSLLIENGGGGGGELGGILSVSVRNCCIVRFLDRVGGTVSMSCISSGSATYASMAESFFLVCDSGSRRLFSEVSVTTE